VIVIHRGKVVADNTIGALRDLMSSGSFEDVFAQLVLRDDPVQTATEIADVVVDHA